MLKIIFDIDCATQDGLDIAKLYMKANDTQSGLVEFEQFLRSKVKYTECECNECTATLEKILTGFYDMLGEFIYD